MWRCLGFFFFPFFLVSISYKALVRSCIMSVEHWDRVLLLQLSLGHIYTHYFVFGYLPFLRLIACIFLWSASVPMPTSIFHTNSSAEILVNRPCIQVQWCARSFCSTSDHEKDVMLHFWDPSHNTQLKEKIEKMPLGHFVLSFLCHELPPAMRRSWMQ